MNEQRQSSGCSERLGSAETSSFKQLIRDVESLVRVQLNQVNDEDDHKISGFDVEGPQILPAMTNGQKLAMLMKSPSTRERVSQYLRSNVPINFIQGYLDLFPILKVRVGCRPARYQLRHEDLVDVFSRFENMQRIIIHPTEIYVFYSDHHSAYFAERSLNDISLESAGAKLVVEWCRPEEYVFISEYLNFERSCPSPQLVRHNSLTNSKFTCRYEIQIDNDKEFQVARRIIGCKGFNMKNIIDVCLSQIGADPKVDSDSIKLRLRGKGSGYREGVNKLESDDPLHLCVSCKDEAAYNKACKMVEELLKTIYQDYKSFCQKTGRCFEDLSVKRLDFNFATKKPSMYNFEQPNETERMSETEIKMYIEARNKARRELNFLEADNIRNFLKGRGITLIDEKGGRGRGVEVTTWRYTN